MQKKNNNNNKKTSPDAYFLDANSFMFVTLLIL